MHCIGFSQDLELVSENPEAEIQMITIKVQEMKNAVNTYKKIIKINNADGHRILFLKGEELKIISLKSTESVLEKSVQWYFINGQLAFSEVTWTNVKTRELFSHDKLYFKNEHLIEWKSEEGAVDPGSQKFKDLDKEMYQSAKTLKNEK